MGRKSVKENKNIYQISREDAGLTREQAAEAIGWMSDDRIEKIENGKLQTHPEDILAFAECYRKPELCNYYCARECPIGERYVPVIQMKELSQIALEVLYALNTLDKKKARFVEIAVDGKIDSAEQEDFTGILSDLDQIDRAVRTLRIWIEKQDLT